MAHSPRDVWVFAYGSLMWQPGFPFAEARHATACRLPPRILRLFGSLPGIADRGRDSCSVSTGAACAKAWPSASSRRAHLRHSPT